jgi:phosphatidylserine/phosphatidylglycerophosphate/cardiolipin synthase-like enzyme
MNLKSLGAPLLCIALMLQAGCAVHEPQSRVADSGIEVGFSPDAGAETLVLKVIGSAHHTIRLAGYLFTSRPVVRALIAAERRGVDVKILIDDRGNRDAASRSAIRLAVNAGIATRVISAYAIHHDKYIIVDGRSTETGSFNYTHGAAHSNSENVLVLWNNPPVAAQYLAHWKGRWAQGIAVEMAQ